MAGAAVARRSPAGCGLGGPQTEHDRPRKSKANLPAASSTLASIGHVAGIEVKAATTVGPDDFRGLRRLADRLGDDFVTGIVLYTGTSTLPFGDRLRAMPVSALWQVPAPTPASAPIAG